MTDNIYTPEFNRFVVDLLDDESSSQESTQESSKSSCPEQFDCFTINFYHCIFEENCLSAL